MKPGIRGMYQVAPILVDITDGADATVLEAEREGNLDGLSNGFDVDWDGVWDTTTDAGQTVFVDENGGMFVFDDDGSRAEVEVTVEVKVTRMGRSES